MFPSCLPLNCKVTFLAGQAHGTDLTGHGLYPAAITRPGCS